MGVRIGMTCHVHHTISSFHDITYAMDKRSDRAYFAAKIAGVKPFASHDVSGIPTTKHITPHMI